MPRLLERPAGGNCWLRIAGPVFTLELAASALHAMLSGSSVASGRPSRSTTGTIPMPDDWIPQLFELLEAAYEEWDRLAMSYAFFGFASALVLALGAVIALALMVGR